MGISSKDADLCNHGCTWGIGGDLNVFHGLQS